MENPRKRKFDDNGAISSSSNSSSSDDQSLAEQLPIEQSPTKKLKHSKVPVDIASSSLPPVNSNNSDNESVQAKVVIGEDDAIHSTFGQFASRDNQVRIETSQWTGGEDTITDIVHVNTDISLGNTSAVYHLILVIDGYVLDKSKMSGAAMFLRDHFGENLHIVSTDDNIEDAMTKALRVTREQWKAHALEQKDTSGATFAACVVINDTFYMMTIGDVRCVFQHENVFTQYNSQVVDVDKKRSRRARKTTFVPKSAGYWCFGKVKDNEHKTLEHPADVHNDNPTALVKRAKRGKKHYVLDKTRKGRGLTTGATFGHYGNAESSIVSEVLPKFRTWEGPGSVLMATDGYWDAVDTCARSGTSRYIRPITRYIARTVGQWNTTSIKPIHATTKLLTHEFRATQTAWDNVSSVIVNVQQKK